MGNFADDLKKLLNKYSMGSSSNTADWILAEFMISVLKAYETAIIEREQSIPIPSCGMCNANNARIDTEEKEEE